MHKFIKLFSRPNATSSENNKPKPYNESVTKRKINEKNKQKIEKAKSNSSENLLNIKPVKRNSSSSVENINQACEVFNNGTLRKERDSAVSLESVLLSDEKNSTMDKQKKTMVKKIPKSPSSSNLLLKRDSDKVKTNRTTSTIKSLAAKTVPDPKIIELKR